MTFNSAGINDIRLRPLTDSRTDFDLFNTRIHHFIPMSAGTDKYEVVSYEVTEFQNS